MTLRLGWFTTARGPGSRAMYEAVAGAIAVGELGAEFAFVFCNRERGENETTDGFFDLVEANGHPLVAQSSVGYRRSAGGERSRPGEPLPPWRIEYDRRVDEALRERDFDIGVLAGYMLIFEREFVAGHSLLNLHPALPDGPTGTWRDVIRQLIRSRAGESGVMLHLAIAEVDLGPVAAYCRYRCATRRWRRSGPPSSRASTPWTTRRWRRARSSTPFASAASGTRRRYCWRRWGSSPPGGCTHGTAASATRPALPPGPPTSRIWCANGWRPLRTDGGDSRAGGVALP